MKDYQMVTSYLVKVVKSRKVSDKGLWLRMLFYLVKASMKGMAIEILQKIQVNIVDNYLPNCEISSLIWKNLFDFGQIPNDKKQR